MIDKEVFKCTPQWSSERDKAKQGEMTHAQWVATWWARPLGQLTVHAAIGHETAPFEALLNQFLHSNRIAVQDTVRTAQCYDAALWSDLSESTKRKDKTCDPVKMFNLVDENRHTRARTTASELANSSRAMKGGGETPVGKSAGKSTGFQTFDNQGKGA